MAKVLVQAVVENLDDFFAVRKGLMLADQIRRIEVNDALIDTGATGLMLPSRMIAHLGLEPLRIRPAAHRRGPDPAPGLPGRPPVDSGSGLYQRCR